MCGVNEAWQNHAYFYTDDPVWWHDWLIGYWYEAPREQRKSRQGKTQFILSQLEVWFTIMTLSILRMRMIVENEVEWTRKTEIRNAE